MIRLARLSCALALLSFAAFAPSQASAEDTLKIAIGQINNWENQPPTLGQPGRHLQEARSRCSRRSARRARARRIQAVISGSADLGVGVGVAGAMRAFSRGAPVRVLLPALHRHRRSLLVREGGIRRSRR